MPFNDFCFPDIADRFKMLLSKYRQILATSIFLVKLDQIRYDLIHVRSELVDFSKCLTQTRKVGNPMTSLQYIAKATKTDQKLIHQDEKPDFVPQPKKNKADPKLVCQDEKTVFAPQAKENTATRKLIRKKNDEKLPKAKIQEKSGKNKKRKNTAVKPNPGKIEMASDSFHYDVERRIDLDSVKRNRIEAEKKDDECGKSLQQKF